MMNITKRFMGTWMGLALAIAVGDPAAARPITAAQPETDHCQYVTERQAVDLLLEQAGQAFKAPARATTPGFTGKLPTNMEIVADRMEKAALLEPYRADLLFTAAGANTSLRGLDKAIALYHKILEIAPEDVDAHSYLAAWQRYKGNQAASESHMKQLRQLNAGRAADLARVFSVIDQVTQMPMRDKLPAEEARAFKGPMAIVTLGYVLNPDGSMNDVLIERLHKTVELAKQLPDALIIVTGGVPHNNRTEARLMAQWLAEHGIEKSRICEDNFARTTVENALYSRYALAKHRIRHAVLTSSGSHVRRAQAIFMIAAWETGPRDIEYVSIATLDKPLEELQKVSNSELLGIYRDALKALGMRSFRSAPVDER
jgi:uncharacterized SAM-binding protein YcdF (DUF218 family)